VAKTYTRFVRVRCARTRVVRWTAGKWKREARRKKTRGLGAVSAFGTIVSEIEKETYLLGLLRRAHVHPENARHERVPGIVERDDRAARGVATQPRDVFGCDPCLL
jgi:hypothetical protein